MMVQVAILKKVLEMKLMLPFLFKVQWNIIHLELCVIPMENHLVKEKDFHPWSPQEVSENLYLFCVLSQWRIFLVMQYWILLSTWLVLLTNNFFFKIMESSDKD